jgi:hypothetical protein
MSGVVSGIGKVFKTVTSGISRVGKAITGVGASVFTAGAAPGGVAAATQAGGTLSNILLGAAKQAGIGALVGGAIGAATGQGFKKGALWGGLGGAALGGLSAAAGGAQQIAGTVPADTATGVAPTGVAATPSGGGGFMKFLQSEGGGALAGNVIAGVGQGLAGYAQQKAEEEKDQRLRDSYSVDPSVYIQPRPTTPPAQLQTPAQAYSRPRYAYDPSVGRIMPVGA